MLDVGADFKEKDSHYNKVIIMTDADTDGAHIQILIINFLLSLYARFNYSRKSIYCSYHHLYKVSKEKWKKRRGYLLLGKIMNLEEAKEENWSVDIMFNVIKV